MQKHSLCTLSLALSMMLWPELATAQSHCRGLDERACSSATACQWRAAREGGMNKSPRKAHCRLDVKAAAKIASEIKR